MPKKASLVKVEDLENSYEEVLDVINDEEQSKLNDVEDIDTACIIPPLAQLQIGDVGATPDSKVTNKENTPLRTPK